MRPTCRWCKAPLTLIRKKDKRWNQHAQLWECKNHPAVDSVIYKFIFKSESARSGGEDSDRVYTRQYLFAGIIVLWTDDTRQYEATFNWERDYGHPNKNMPGLFWVSKIARPGEKLNFHQRQILRLEEHPTYLTPENMASKVKTYVVFS